MNTDLTTVNSTELDDDIDTNRYGALNYFRTQDQTAEAAKRVKEALMKYHEEIGEYIIGYIFVARTTRKREWCMSLQLIIR